MTLLRTVQSTVIAAVVATVGIGIAAPQQASADAGTTASAARSHAKVRVVAPSFESEVLRLTNRERQKRGLRLLVRAQCTERVSARWAWNMAARNRFRHQSMRRVARACGTRYVGENIAMGRPLGAAQVVSLWMHSAGHRTNILNPHYRFLGVGAYQSTQSGRVYVVQDFRG